MHNAPYELFLPQEAKCGWLQSSLKVLLPLVHENYGDRDQIKHHEETDTPYHRVDYRITYFSIKSMAKNYI